MVPRAKRKLQRQQYPAQCPVTVATRSISATGNRDTGLAIPLQASIQNSLSAILESDMALELRMVPQSGAKDRSKIA